MEDQEMLEMAAKAAGLELHYCEPWEAMTKYSTEDGYYGPSWNPLVDDGDALRLAVKLDMLVDVMISPPQSHVFGGFQGNVGEAVEPNIGMDKCAATRRAIVRAAAAIGKGMEKLGLPD